MFDTFAVGSCHDPVTDCDVYIQVSNPCGCFVGCRHHDGAPTSVDSRNATRLSGRAQCLPGNVELIVPAKFSIRRHDSNGIRLSKQRDPITVTDRFGHREVSVRYHEPSGKLDCSFPQFVAVIVKRSHDAAEATSGRETTNPSANSSGRCGRTPRTGRVRPSPKRSLCSTRNTQARAVRMAYFAPRSGRRSRRRSDSPALVRASTAPFHRAQSPEQPYFRDRD